MMQKGSHFPTPGIGALGGGRGIQGDRLSVAPGGGGVGADLEKRSYWQDPTRGVRTGKAQGTGPTQAQPAWLRGSRVTGIAHRRPFLVSVPQPLLSLSPPALPPTGDCPVVPPHLPARERLAACQLLTFWGEPPGDPQCWGGRWLSPFEWSAGCLSVRAVPG